MRENMGFVFPSLECTSRPSPYVERAVCDPAPQTDIKKASSELGSLSSRYLRFKRFLDWGMRQPGALLGSSDPEALLPPRSRLHDGSRQSPACHQLCIP